MAQAKKVLTRVEKLVRSLEIKRNNLANKWKALEDEHQKEAGEIIEKMEVINLQLTRLKK